MRIKLILIIIMFLSGQFDLEAGWFELGKSPTTQFQYGMSFSYENDDVYYDSDAKEMKEMPDDWNIEYYSYSVYFKVNLTKNISFKISFPYYNNKYLKYYSDGTEYYKEGIGWGDISVTAYYRYFNLKRPLLEFIKDGKIMMNYLFERGDDELFLKGISYGRNDVKISHSIRFVFPKKWDKKLNKKLSIQNDFGYTIAGRSRSYVQNYSKTGFKNGDGISVKSKINYVINTYLRVSVYHYYSYYFDDKDVNDNIVDDSYTYCHSIGVSLSWRPFGDNTVSLQFGNEYPFKYKDSYIAYFNPSIKFSYNF